MSIHAAQLFVGKGDIMTAQANSATSKNCLFDAIASAFSSGSATVRSVSEQIPFVGNAFSEASRNAASFGDSLAENAYQFVEENTERIGRIVTPIVDNPVVKFATKVPFVNVLMAAIGQVNVDQVTKDIDELRQQHPYETPDQLAHRVMVDASAKAATIGLMTNFIPPLALILGAADLAALSALQAEMIYRIAVIYGFPLQEPTRRGEVLAIWAITAGGSSTIKAGLSVVELLPGLGALIGTTGDALLLYSLGYAACRFYETKQRKAAEQVG